MSGRAALGIDPGASGALAIVTDTEVRVWDMPRTAKGMACPGKLLGVVVSIMDHLIARDLDLHAAAVEQVASRPKQGVASTFKFGASYGVALSVAARIADYEGLDPVYDVTNVTPVTWKRHHRLLKQSKAAACERAAERWPDERATFYGPRGGALDGRADAALIAAWALDTVPRTTIAQSG